MASPVGARPPLPLDRNSRYVRLLKVDTSVRPFQCTLTVHPLDNVPDFCALSYCWGEPSEQNSIICNEVAMPVRDNLYSFLCHVRSGPGFLQDYFWWIDAICIDQSNDEEKGHQVGLMGQIYAAASKTVVWLGEAPPDQHQLIELIQSLSRAVRQNPALENAGYLNLSGRQLSAHGLPEWRYNREPLLEPFDRFLNLGYWRRSWIIQEFALSKESMFMQGCSIYDLRDVFDAMRTMQVVSGWTYYANSSRWAHMIRLLAVRGDCQKSRAHKLCSRLYGDVLLDLLTKFKSAACDDPRDKIFCMLGILETLATPSDPNQKIVPDYNMCTSALYEAVAISILAGASDLTILASLRPQDLPPRALSSWVPDFGTTSLHPILADLNGNGALDGWAASGAELVFDVVDNKRLRLVGHTIDQIAMVSDLVPEIDDLSKQLAQHFRDVPLHLKTSVANVLRSRLLVCPREGSYVTGCSAAEAFWSTVLIYPEHHQTLLRQVRDTDNWTSLEEYILDPVDAAVSGSEHDGRFGESNDSWLIALICDNLGLTNSMKLARTRGGYYCNVPWQTKVGDAIILAAGGKFPLVSRRFDGPGDPRYVMLGGCYVHGVMHGEAWRPEEAQDMWFE